jgi:C1A family cysteine protease
MRIYYLLEPKTRKIKTYKIVALNKEESSMNEETFKSGWRLDPEHLKPTFNNFNQDKFSLTSNPGDVDLRKYSPPQRHDQGSTSSCVCNAMTRALEIKRIMKLGQSYHVPLSRMDLYYGCRDRMTPSETKLDQGTYIYLAAGVLCDFGVCREDTHPFNYDNLYKLPPVMASREARLNRVNSQFRINSLNDDRIDDMIFNLRAGNPIVFGTTVGKDWMEYSGGKKVLTVETRPLGGHAILVCGYVGGNFIIENSWSNNWGLNGFGIVDPEVFKQPETTDLWVIVDGSEAWQEKK